MAHQEHAGSSVARGIREQPLTRLASGGRQAARRLLALPLQRLEPDAQPRSDGAALLNPTGARGLQPVIHGQRDYAATVRVGPRLRQQQQRQRVPTAGEGNGERPLGLRGEPPVERCQAAHLAWARAAVAFLVTEAEAFGYLALSASSVLQASSARFMAISSRDSSAMASGAQPVLG